MTKIKYNKISKKYNKIDYAVQDVSFEVQSGEFLVLVGPSGCGKSTILRMTAGLEEITEGQVFFDEQLINDFAPKDRNIGMVFQNYALYPHLTVYENIAFPLKINKEKNDFIKKRVEEIAQIVDLSEYLKRKPKELSGGQRQRVALGRAIARTPKVFLFDEPLSNLDAKLRVQMRTEIINLQKAIGSTAIYVTHDQTEAMTMGHRLVVMKDGIIRQIDTPMNLYNNPTDVFVAGFIGSPQMNFFNGKIIIESGINFIENQTNNKIKLNPENFISDKIANGMEVTIGIRPENIKIANSITDHSITASISNIEYLGHESIIYFKTNGLLKCVRTSEHITADKSNMIFELDKSSIFVFGQDEKRV